MATEPNEDPVAVYTYKGRRYVIIDHRPSLYRMKNPTDGNWHDAVEYIFADGEAQTDEEKDMVFVRTADDFLAKFTYEKAAE
jgi:hypothetical protein